MVVVLIPRLAINFSILVVIHNLYEARTFYIMSAGRIQIEDTYTYLSESKNSLSAMFHLS